MRPSSPMRLVEAPLSSTAAYAGRDYLGEVVELDNGQFIATDAAGYRLGLYETRREAEHAVWLASRAAAGALAETRAAEAEQRERLRSAIGSVS